MGVVADLADRVVVMRNGSVVGAGTAEQIFTAPVAGCTRDLLAAVPRIGDGDRRPAFEEASDPVVRVRDLAVEFRVRLRGTVRAVDGVSFDIARGEVLGLVGESGSGKTTVARSLIGLSPVSAGSVAVEGTDIATARGAERRDATPGGRRVPEPARLAQSALHRRAGGGRATARARRAQGSELDDRVDGLLAAVALGGGRWRTRYPHELSGGQRRRVAIARAVSLDPVLLVADEPTSALDVSVQAQVLELLAALQERIGFSCLFVSHDLAVIDAVCDRVAVMRHGRIVGAGRLRDGAAVAEGRLHAHPHRLGAGARPGGAACTERRVAGGVIAWHRGARPPERRRGRRR